MSTSTRDPTIEKLIRDGHQHYLAGRYKAAGSFFSKAMKLCSCNRGTRRERCTCKNYEEVASRDGSIFEEAMYQCRCNVGRTFNKCDNFLHIQAVDYRAASFEGQRKLDWARSDAEWVLELNPRLPDGYLRLGKIARMQRKKQFALKVYTAGIEVCEPNPSMPRAKIERLYAMQRSLQKQLRSTDPFNFPLDIVQLILRYLDFSDLMRCIRVSSTWYRSLTSYENRFLWRQLMFFSTSQTRPSQAVLSKLVNFSGGDVREITIQNAGAFNLTRPRFSILLRGALNLERLEVHWNPPDDDWVPSEVTRLTKLRHLVAGVPDFPALLVDNISSRLVHLHIVRYPPTRVAQHAQQLEMLPLMPNLQYFRYEDRVDQRTIVAMGPLLKSIPNVEQIYLTGATPFTREGFPVEEDDEAHENCKRLKVLILRDISMKTHSEIYGVARLVSVAQGQQLQHLDIKCDFADTDTLGLFGRMFTYQQIVNIRPWEARSVSPEMLLGAAIGDLPLNSFPKLQALRLYRFCLNGAESERMLGASVENNNLHTINIVFGKPEFAEVDGLASCERMAQFSWLKGSPSVRRLGLFDFRFVRYHRDDNDFPLPDFVASFPNLETLEIESQYYENEEMVSCIIAILRRTQLKTLMQKTVSGVNLDRLRHAIKRAGIKLVMRRELPQWPITLVD